MPTTGVVIRDTPGMSISKKKAPAKADRGKGIELLLDVALLEDAQLKKALKKSKQKTYKIQASGSSEGADFKSKVPDDSKAKSSDTSEGTGVKPGVLYVSKADSFESDNESWEDSKDDNESDDNNDEGSENNDDDDDYFVPTDEETYDENKEFDDEEYDDFYKDVNVRSKVVEHEEVRKGYVEMTDATRESGSQEKSHEQVIKDEHMTLTTSHKNEGSKQSSFVSSEFASKFLILDYVPPVVDEVSSMETRRGVE
nr:hypothetical protein [Tanacetum cinerariifolium]